jgi:hypothetical protein
LPGSDTRIPLYDDTHLHSSVLAVETSQAVSLAAAKARQRQIMDWTIIREAATTSCGRRAKSHCAASIDK